MQISGIPIPETAQVKRFAPGDPFVRGFDQPDRFEQAARIFDSAIRAKMVTAVYEYSTNRTIEHVKGMIAMLTDRIAALPLSTPVAERESWAREIADQRSYLVYQRQEKANMGRRHAMNDELMQSALKLVRNMLTPEEAAALYAERKAAIAAENPMPEDMPPPPLPEASPEPADPIDPAALQIAKAFGPNVTAFDIQQLWWNSVLTAADGNPFAREPAAFRADHAIGNHA